MAVCAEPGCTTIDGLHRGYCQRHRRQRDRQRNARPERDIYRGDWARRSRAIIARAPWCHRVDWMRDECHGGLTVDHGWMLPLCRRHHAQLEASRRRATRTIEGHGEGASDHAEVS